MTIAASHFSNKTLTRRDFTKAALTFSGAIVCGNFLTSCASTNSSPGNLIIPAAFSDPSFTSAQKAAVEKADDVVLIAVRLAQSIFPDTQQENATWMYLFGSQKNNMAYTVFPAEEPYAAAFENYALTQKEWEDIPSLDNLTIDAHEAYEILIEHYPDQLTTVENCYVFLMTYIAEDSDPLKDSMKWFFDFNYEPLPEDEGSPEEKSQEESLGESNPDGITYYVNAIDGTCGLAE